MNDELPCLDLLEATPAILRGLMSEISGGDARWKPAPDRFSIAEVLAHLSHSEGHCYRARVDRFLAEEMPELEPDEILVHPRDARHVRGIDRTGPQEGAIDRGLAADCRQHPPVTLARKVLARQRPQLGRRRHRRRRRLHRVLRRRHRRCRAS